MIRDYSDEIDKLWPTIMRAWEEHGDKRPVIECNLPSMIVAAYPAQEYINGLTERTREKARQEYDRVTGEGGIMIFIRDSVNRVLQSCSYFAIDEIIKGKPKKRLKRKRNRDS